MTETTEACARGCSMYRRHLADCADPDRCRGCLPRRAQHGHLCWPCHRRLELMLTDAPGVWRLLTGNLSLADRSIRMKQDYERRGGGGEKGLVETPAPLSVEILDCRDLLASRLAIWCEDWAETHDVTAPVHVAMSTSVSIEASAEFLLRWLPGLERLEWIGDWWAELAETMIDAHALAPWRPALKRVTGIPCPECEETNLVIHGGESDVTCQSCRTMIRAEHFALWERIIEDERRVAG